jgi:hypothetical protein
MVFVLPAEFHAQGREELPVAQLDLGPRPVIFEKPQAKNYKHLNALYLTGYINGQPINKMLVDTGAAVNRGIVGIPYFMPWSKKNFSLSPSVRTGGCITMGDYSRLEAHRVPK